jgi:hypothetical protein
VCFLEHVCRGEELRFDSNIAAPARHTLGSLGYSRLSVLVLVVFLECVGLLVILGVVY